MYLLSYFPIATNSVSFSSLLFPSLQFACLPALGAQITNSIHAFVKCLVCVVHCLYYGLNGPNSPTPHSLGAKSSAHSLQYPLYVFIIVLRAIGKTLVRIQCLSLSAFSAVDRKAYCFNQDFHVFCVSFSHSLSRRFIRLIHCEFNANSYSVCTLSLIPNFNRL